MQKNGVSLPGVGLSLLLWRGVISRHLGAPGTLRGPLDDFTFGFCGTAREESRMDREDIIAREGYCPTGGCVLRLDRVEVKPNRARKATP